MRKLFLILPFFLAACGGGAVPWLQIEGEQLTPQQELFGLVASYDELRASIEEYAASGPLCSASDVVGCVSDTAVIKLDDATDRLDPIMAEVARVAPCLSDPPAVTSALACASVDQGETAVRRNVRLAKAAVRQLAFILAEEGIQ